ncbi:TetR/AcrR family transcriptional regulator [Actinophytocola gossypii]|uniref:TetR family transcriptional regulator n=1 Tax=Actinophytocola gossypii TaxID=2812003 RepID=A0ABT2J7T5_9PSEU|nr:TetR/AcrR family transcriptional regulator [Actinophytocola gossypii]MCT2583912.1 TetR family transcriptional regulator [Actinophytocola gossypii]
MTEPGLRERKKQRTRRALVDAAMRLFDEQGYDETSVAAIAAAAEVSTRTFFTHFPTKDDVFFASNDEGIDAALGVLATRAAGERPLDVLVRAVERMSVAHSAALAHAAEFGPLRLRLLNSVPALRARAVHRFADAQQRLADALHDAYPEVDRVTASATVGALVGAVVSTTLSGLAAHEPDLPDALRRAIDVAVQGVAVTLDPLCGRDATDTVPTVRANGEHRDTALPPRDTTTMP